MIVQKLQVNGHPRDVSTVPKDDRAKWRIVVGRQDLLAASANNLYVGVTMSDLDGFAERHALNSRLVKRDGRLVVIDAYSRGEVPPPVGPRASSGRRAVHDKIGSAS